MSFFQILVKDNGEDRKVTINLNQIAYIRPRTGNGNNNRAVLHMTVPDNRFGASFNTEIFEISDAEYTAIHDSLQEQGQLTDLTVLAKD